MQELESVETMRTGVRKKLEARQVELTQILRKHDEEGKRLWVQKEEVQIARRFLETDSRFEAAHSLLQHLTSLGITV